MCSSVRVISFEILADLMGKPKLWERFPSCIISMYGPTDLLSLIPVRRGAFEDFKMPDITPVMIKAALIEPPPTETLPLRSPAAGGGLDPRMLLSLGVIGGGVVGEFLEGIGGWGIACEG